MEVVIVAAGLDPGVHDSDLMERIRALAERLFGIVQVIGSTGDAADHPIYPAMRYSAERALFAETSAERLIEASDALSILTEVIDDGIVDVQATVGLRRDIGELITQLIAVKEQVGLDPFG